MDRKTQERRLSQSRFELYIYEAREEKLIATLHNWKKWSKLRCINYLREQYSTLILHKPYVIQQVIRAYPTDEPYYYRKTKKDPRPVVAINHYGKVAMQFDSYKQALHSTNYDMTKALYKKRKSAGNMIWLFKEEFDTLQEDEIKDLIQQAGIPKVNLRHNSKKDD